MPTRKVSDLPKAEGCQHSDHNPPSFRVYEPGVYEHECSGCGRKTRFIVHGVRYSAGTDAEWVTSFNNQMDGAMKQLDKAMKTMEKAFEGW